MAEGRKIVRAMELARERAGGDKGVSLEGITLTPKPPAPTPTPAASESDGKPAE